MSFCFLLFCLFVFLPGQLKSSPLLDLTERDQQRVLSGKIGSAVSPALLRVHTFTFRGALQRDAVCSASSRASSSPTFFPPCLSLTTLAPSLLHCLAAPTTARLAKRERCTTCSNAAAAFGTKCKLAARALLPHHPPSCSSLLPTLRIVTCNHFLHCTSLQVRVSPTLPA